MIETHPFKPFIPEKPKTLMLGSFLPKRKVNDTTIDWYYGSRRSQFWPILEKVYKVELKDKESKQKLFSTLNIALSDIIYQCERRDDNSLDSNLVNIVYNFEIIEKILSENHIEKIIFTSKFVEKEFKKNFKTLISKYESIEFVTLPSPSPRYALITKEEKIKRYLELLPKI